MSRSGGWHSDRRTVVTAPSPQPERFDNEDAMIEVIRAHLREARRNTAVGKLVFDIDVNRGGLARWWVEMTCRYRFLQNSGAVSTPNESSAPGERIG